MEKKINTNNGKQGGTLEGPSHDNGGIKVIITDDNRPVEVEGGEVIINKHAAKKHWKTLSKINQSAGNGVTIHEPKFKKGGNTPEQPTEKELEQRWEKKKTSIEELANNISSLRNNITRDLSNEDEKTALTALVIAIIDTTAERVGNEDSAENGHFGVTGFQKKHIKIEGNKVTFKYVGKSGVEHDTSFTDEKIANALKKAISNSPSKFVFRTTDDFQIKADKVNRYLSDFNVTAKDLRGYSANKWIIEKLKQITPEQEETKRQKQFNEIVSSVAEKIGHGKATLKNHYLVPELEAHFVENAKIIDIKKLGGDLYKKGRTIAQTPAPKKDRIYGSKVNKEGSSESLDSAKSIKFDDKTLQSIESKVKEHNAKYPNKKIDLASAKAVVRRGMGAYSSSHRPTITDGKANSRVAWGLARLNAFIYKVVNGKSKSGKYSQDNDLLDELNIKHQKFSEGGTFKVGDIIVGKHQDDNYVSAQADAEITDIKDIDGETIVSIEGNGYSSNISMNTLKNQYRLATDKEIENAEKRGKTLSEILSFKTGGQTKKLTKEEFIEWLKSRTNKAFVDYRVWDIYERGNNRYFSASKGENYGYDYSGKINRINALNLKDSEKVGEFEFSVEEKVGLIIKSDNGKWFYLIGKDGNDFYAIIDGDSRLYVVKDMAKRWGYKLLSAKQYNDYYNVPERYRMYEHRRKLKTGGDVGNDKRVLVFKKDATIRCYDDEFHSSPPIERNFYSGDKIEVEILDERELTYFFKYNFEWCYVDKQSVKTEGNTEEKEIYFNIEHEEYGWLELGMFEVSNGFYSVRKVDLNLSKAFENLFNYLKSENGQYISQKYPKSKYAIYKCILGDATKESQYKKVYSIAGKEVNELNKIYKLEKGGELEKGIKVESEHIDTAKKLYRREITPQQAAESIAREHIKEDPKYYTKLSSIEKHKKGTNISKFKGLDKALSEYEDLDVLSYIEDPNISNVYLFLFRFKRNYKNLNDKFGIFIYNDNTQKFIEEPDSLNSYNTKYEKLDKKYPKLNVLKHVKYKYEKGANISPNLTYKKGDTIRFNYGRADERKVLVGIITDYLNNDKGYVVTAGYSQIAVDEKDVLGLDEVKETKKRFLFFEQGGVADFDIADYYEMTFAGGGAIEKAKTIITQKIGLNEDSANYLTSMSPKLAVWLADSILKYEIDDLTKGYNEAEKHLSDENKTSKDKIKEYALSNINLRSNYIRVNFGSGIRSIIDWISHPLTPNQNLKQLSFQEAIDKAHIFHEELKVLGGDIDYKEPKENEIIKEYPESDDVKYYWVYIPSNFCNIESSRMGHCGRTGYGNTLISLRSVKPYGKGHTISDSHITIAYNPNEGLFYQTKGKKNQKPAEKYHWFIFDLITDMAKDEVRFPIPSEYTGQIDEKPLEFNGFGSEYDSKEDYGFDDMTKEQIEILYSIKPDIFRNFEGQYLLYETGISVVKPNTTFILEKSAKDVQDLVRVDRNLSSDIVYNIITGDTYDYYDNWSYNYEDGWESAIDYYLDKKNEDTIIDEIVRITNYSKDEVTEKGIVYYLKGEDDNFDSDYFDNIKRAIVSAISDAERFDYENYLYKQLKDALSELGVVKQLNDEGVKIGIDLSDFLTIKEISNYMKELETEELEDVFYEAFAIYESDGNIVLPRFDIDDRYTPYASKEDFNSILSDIDLESGYKKGGSITSAQKNKVAKVMHEWKAGRLHSGSKKGPIVKDQKQAVAIALSQAGLSKKETGGNIDKETYDKWKSLVNMTYSELKKFYESEEGKVAGLTTKQAKELDIKSGRESAKWIMKMKQTNVSDWTPKMWEWAKRQISFISRMSGTKWPLYDEDGNKTRKHTSLLIWGHNPEKANVGLLVAQYAMNKKQQKDKELSEYKSAHEGLEPWEVEAKKWKY